VLIVLLVLPGGLGSLWVKLRDTFVRLLTGHRVDEPIPTVAVVGVEPRAESVAIEPQPQPQEEAESVAETQAEAKAALVPLPNGEVEHPVEREKAGDPA
jgi:hypothetical protein